MSYQNIISAEDLNKNLNNENWFVFDCRFLLKDPQGGRNKFNQGHIPSAQFADMDTDLSSAMTKTSGRHPLPDPETFMQKLRSWGTSNHSQVVCYDDISGAFAARMWWLLNWVGHKDVAVLDGGIEQWTKAGLPLEQDTQARATGTFSGTANHAMWVGITFIQQQLAENKIKLLDARSTERFTAEDKKTDPVLGHIPGAESYPFSGNLNQEGVFLSASNLQDRFTPVFSGHSTEQIISMCGSGVTACHNLLAMHVAGHPLPRLYVGSWSEWIKDSDRPVATGYP